MLDSETRQRLQQQVAGTLLSVVREGGFDAAQLFWSELAGSSAATLTVLDARGTSAMVKTPNDVFDTLEELRAAMAEPDIGAWLSMGARVRTDGSFEFDFNYDRRPYWNAADPLAPSAREMADPNPADEAFVEDLADHPRAAEHLPRWYPTGDDRTANPVTAPLPGISGAALFPASLAALASSDDWVGIAESVRRHLAAVMAEDPAADDGFVVQDTYERVFTERLAGRSAAFVKRIWAPANSAAGYPPKSTDVPDDELVAQPSETLEILLEDISDVIADIAEHQLAPGNR